MEMTRLLTASISLPDRPYETAEDRLRFYRALESRLREIGDVSSASVTTSLPLGGAPARSFDIEGRPTPSKESEQSARMVSIGTQYFSTLQVPLVRGRDFRTHDAERGEETAIINQRFADTYFPKTIPSAVA